MYVNYHIFVVIVVDVGVPSTYIMVLAIVADSDSATMLTVQFGISPDMDMDVTSDLLIPLNALRSIFFTASICLFKFALAVRLFLDLDAELFTVTLPLLSIIIISLPFDTDCEEL